MLKFSIWVWNICYKFLSTYCAKEYQLKLEGYKYLPDKNTYILMFRIRTKPITQQLDVNELFFDSELLDLIHPIDSYIVGIIYGICRNQVKVYNDSILERFQKPDSYRIVDPSLWVTTQYMNEETDFIVLQNKSRAGSFKVSISELCKKTFLLDAIGSRESCKLGFFISEKFIAEVN